MPTSDRRSRTLRARLASLRRRSPDQEAPQAEEADPRVELLVGSALFDHDWYSLCVGRQLNRRAAATHYLGSGRGKGLTPHPLFAPDHSAAQLGVTEAAVDPFVVYLSERRFDAEVHPLFDVGRYVAENPAALDHPEGPLGHYRDHGAALGARVNDWYQPSADEPRGLVDWLWRQAREWAERDKVALPGWGRARARGAAGAEVEPVDDSRIASTTVILVAEHGGDDLRSSVESLLAQNTEDWELVVLAHEHGVDPHECDLPQDPRIRIAPGTSPTPWVARNEGLALARGTHVAWMIEGDVWLPGRLSAVHRALVEGDHQWAHDCARDERPGVARRHASRRTTRERLLAGIGAELGTLVVSRNLALALGGFDLSLRGGQVLDFMLRLSEHEEAGFAPKLGVKVDRNKRRSQLRRPARFRPYIDFELLPAAADVVLNTHLVDWSDLAARRGDEGLVSVIVPTHQDWEMTSLAVRRVVESRQPDLRVEVIVVDNGCPLVAASVLGSLAVELEDVRVVRSPVNHGFALGNNLALPHVRGATVIFLNNDTEVQPGWLAPLVAALGDERVLGAQSLLVYPEGGVQSAGVVFPRGGGIPHVLLQGFPTEDAHGMEADPLHALTGAALAMRYPDVVALHGFDPVFRNGMEDVDICLRLGQARPGRFVVCPDSVVIHHESKSPGRFANSVTNRRVLVDRWLGRLPQDDVEAWGRRGYDVMGHQVRNAVSPDRRLCVAEPVLVRKPRLEVREGQPSLRWAIKNPAPFGPDAERWGDTHYARRLAAALRGLGQEVVIDYRGEFDRPSGWHDEVVLLLRGLAPYTPVLDRVNLMWLISHPDMITPFEHLGWDRVYVASIPFARTLAEEWGAPAVPLLQATDPALFNPDLAVPDTGHRLLFVGNSRKQARPLVVGAAEQGLPLSVIGGDWEGLIPAKYVRGRFLPNSELGAAYRAAGVVLNDHWSDMYDQGFLSNRLFDAVAAGARVVSDDVEGIEEVFGDAVQVVSNPRELAELVSAPDLDTVFGTDDVRRERAAKVAAEHSFDERARFLLQDAVRIRAERGLR